MEPGRAVLSKAGRDAGRRFIVVEVDDTFAYVADGDLRKVESLKKKKHRHLRPLPVFFQEIADMLGENRRPSNAEIRRCLASSIDPNPKGRI